jgi:RNase P protein component
MKRRLREAVRLTRPAPSPSVDVVINPKKTLLAADFDGVLNEVRQAFVVIEQKLSKSVDRSLAVKQETGIPKPAARKR